MPVQWQKLLHSTLFWLVAEIIFNTMGIDTLADYSEFVFANNSSTRSHISISID